MIISVTVEYKEMKIILQLSVIHYGMEKDAVLTTAVAIINVHHGSTKSWMSALQSLLNLEFAEIKEDQMKTY